MMTPGDHLTIWDPKAPEKRGEYTVWAIDDRWLDIVDRGDGTGRSRQRLPREAFKERMT
jgi:hypothetical protein